MCLGFSSTSWAEPSSHIALLHAHTPEELAGILDQAEAWANTRSEYPDQPITIVLHGKEANVFVRQNYQMYRQLVDKAARLDAFNVVDIKICETWMGMNQVRRDQLPAFVDTVPFGPGEEKRLLKAGYQSF
ncbi:DsrE family protein [Pseudomonas sp. HK3]|jgi:intracellular sulfur oxidation DsrE/DsrF family protein